MKSKRKLMFICLMIVIFVFSVVFAVNAADTATATVEEVTMTTTKNGVTTTRSGSFDSFMLELDNQETSESENAT